MSNKPERRALKRHERKWQMVAAVLLREEKDMTPHTAYSLAKSLDMRPSPHFRGILKELVGQRILFAVEATHRPGWQKRYYTAHHDLIKHFYPDLHKTFHSRKKKRDTIHVNVGGQQMDMFANWR